MRVNYRRSCPLAVGEEEFMMTTIPSNGASSHKSGFRFSGSGACKFLFTALAAILLAQTALAADVAGTARLIRERRGHTATAIGGGKILVAGGQNLSGALADVETFDAATGTFSVAARLLTPRAEHTATRLADGRVFLIGGRGTDALASTELFDPTRNVFSSGPSLNSPRFGHTSTLLPDGRVVVIGGNAAGTAEIFDPRAGTFSALPCHLSEPRSFHAAVRLLDGSILIAGGISTEGKTLRAAEILHPDTLECEPIGTMFAARSRFTLRMLPDGKVQAIGGDAERTMEIFNPEGYFSSLAHLAGTPEIEAAALRSPGRVAIMGPSARTISDAPAPVAGGREIVRPVQNLLDRADYSMTEISEAGVAVAAGGVSSAGRYQQTAVLFESSAATVTTDKTDYQPGETVVITGTGWLPGETVTLNLHRDTNEPPDTVLTTVADALGNISNSEYVCQEFDRGVTFLLTATGQTSGFTAQTTFTDDKNLKITFAGSGGGSITFSGVSPDPQPTPNPCTATCTQNLNNVATGTMTVTANTGSVFAGWSGTWDTSGSPPGTTTCTGTTSPCTFSMGNKKQDLTATFNGVCDGKANGFPCRASAGACDVAETCNGVSPLCPADAKSTAVCRADAGQCDVAAESCDGVSNDCPADAFEPAGTSCGSASDTECTNPDTCNGSGTCQANDEPATATCGDAGTECTNQDFCNGSGSCTDNGFKTSGIACSDSNACTQTDQCNGSGQCVGSNPVVCTASDQCHVAGICDPGTGVCSNPNKADDTSCTDGDACTQTDTCQTGTCTGSNPVTCAALDQCHVAGTCEPTSGICSNPNKTDGTACTDNNACTIGDSCQAGSCSSGTATVCTALDQCHVAGTCDTGTGACSNPNASNGTVCTDNSACTTGDSCQAGVCSGAGNLPPDVTSTSGPAPIPLTGGTANSGTVTAYFTDPDPGQTHTCTISWDDESYSSGAGVAVTEPNATTQGTCTGSHTYTSTGVYTVTFTISDGCNGTGTGKFEFIVIYDPNGGFVTGGGWIDSPAGAYAAIPALAGKANFGFVSKYKNTKSTTPVPPEGETEFQFKAGDLNFHSAAYEWLVVSGAKARYRGTGTINGSGSHAFELTAIDGAITGGLGTDKIRMKIWDTNQGSGPSGVIYDNQMIALDGADPTTVLGGGSIVIHKAK
jgi:hypothetical protein